MGILRNLEHPNVLAVYQFFKDDPKYYFLSHERANGGELFDRIVKKVSVTDSMVSVETSRLPVMTRMPHVFSFVTSPVCFCVPIPVNQLATSPPAPPAR